MMCDPIAKLPDAKATITGIRTVAEITQMFQPKIMLKVRSDLQQKRKPNFSWIPSIISSCKDLSSDPSMKGLNDTVKCLLRNLQEAIKFSLKNAKRSHRLKMHIQTFLTYFYMIYGKIQKPFDRTNYKERIGAIMAMYIDLELRSSRICKPELKLMISGRICAYLFLCLDHSVEHILDAIFKSTKFIIKSYNDICSAVMKRVLHDSPLDDYDINYVRYLLAYKLWMKIAGKEHHSYIKKEAILKLTPPSDFLDKLKSDKFENILPYLPKPDRLRATTFYMQSQFDLKDKIQAFLKQFRSTENEEDHDDAIIILEECDDSTAILNDDQDQDLLEKIWSKCNDNEICDDTLCVLDEIETIIYAEEDDLSLDLKKDRPSDGLHSFSNGLENRFLSLSRKRFDNIPESVRSDDKSKEENMTGPLATLDVLHQKPYATIGPEQCKEGAHENKSAVTTAELADSSGILEQNKDVTNETFFDIREDNVAEEVIIGTETFNVSSPFIVESAEKENIDGSLVINEIEIPVDSESTCTSQTNISVVKNQQIIASKSHQLLPFVVSPDTVSLARRQDSYSHNDLMLTKLISSAFSDATADDNSDEENHHVLKQYSRGGKIPAFRQIIESKSDSGEDFESSSPFSESIVVDASYINTTEPISCVGNSIEYDLKTPTLSPIKGESFTLCKVSEEQLDTYPNGGVGYLINSKDVCIPFDTVLHKNTVRDDVNFYNYQKNCYEILETTSDIMSTNPVLHPNHEWSPVACKTRCQCSFCLNNYLSLQSNYSILYTIRSNKICFEVDKHRSLAKKSHEVNIASEENAQLLKEIEESITNNESLSNNPSFEIATEENCDPGSDHMTQSSQKCIETVDNFRRVEDIGVNNGGVTLAQLSNIESNVAHATVINKISTDNEIKSDYQSLPPKKRKAFGIQVESPKRKANSDFDNMLQMKKQDNLLEGNNRANNIVIENNPDQLSKPDPKKRKLCNNMDSGQILKHEASRNIIKECSIIVDRLEKYSPVKIRSVEGTYCVLSDSRPSNSEETCVTTQFTDSKGHDKRAKKDKCHRHKKRSKEERKIRREQRRLRKMMKDSKS